MIFIIVIDDDLIIFVFSWFLFVIIIALVNWIVELGVNVILKCVVEGDFKFKIRYSLCNGSVLRMYSRYKY